MPTRLLHGHAIECLLLQRQPCSLSCVGNKTQNMQPLPNVRVQDQGAKMGANGVENAKIFFDGTRVPRTALLNRYSDVSDDPDCQTLST